MDATNVLIGQITQDEFIQNIGSLIASHSFNFCNEIQLQDGLEAIFKNHQVIYSREVHLSNRDIVDFMLDFNDQHIALEVKIGGTRNALLRQAARYLEHKSVAAIFIVGTPHWVLNMPQELSEKQVYCHRIIAGVF